MNFLQNKGLKRCQIGKNKWNIYYFFNNVPYDPGFIFYGISLFLWYLIMNGSLTNISCFVCNIRMRVLFKGKRSYIACSPRTQKFWGKTNCLHIKILWLAHPFLYFFIQVFFQWTVPCGSLFNEYIMDFCLYKFQQFVFVCFKEGGRECVHALSRIIKLGIILYWYVILKIGYKSCI
jgi:hypothetical protein